MTYTIGIGALLEGESFNAVRSLELTAASVTSNHAGLDQPPHITIKRPFEVNSISDIDKVLAAINEVAEKTSAFNMQYSGLGNFGETTLFLGLESSVELEKLHNELLSKLRASFIEAESPHEGQQMIFHTSIATNLQTGQLALVQDAISEASSAVGSVKICKLGLFLGLDNNTRWVIVFEQTLN